MDIFLNSLKDWAKIAVILLKLSGQQKLFKSNANLLDSKAFDHIRQLQSRRIDSLLYLHLEKENYKQQVYDKVWSFQRACLEELITELISENILALVFKGAEIISRFFNSHAINLLGDVDVLVPRYHLSKVKRTLIKLGYRQAKFNSEHKQLIDIDAINVAQIESNHYELIPFSKVYKLSLEPDELAFAQSLNRHPLFVCGEECFVVVEIDVHFQVASDIHSEKLFERAKSSSLGIGKTLSDTDHLWICTSRYYTEVSFSGKSSLRDFAYISPLFYSCKIDWDVILSVASQYEIRSSLYYYLSFLDQLFGQLIPREVLDQLNPRRDPSISDRGWQLGQLLDFTDPLPFTYNGTQSEEQQQVLFDTLEYLKLMVRGEYRPIQAKERLNLLQKQHPRTKIDLLWEEEPYDHSVHYDALLYFSEEGTVSMSFCPERSLPWPLRGVHRWSEQDLVRVNSTILKVGEAIAYLDFIWDEKPLIKRLLDVCIIREEFEKEPIDISDSKLQQEMDAFRRANGLHKASDLHHWMKQNGITHEKLEQLITERVMITKLRDKVANNFVEDYFKKHRIDFDTAYIAQLMFPDEESAHKAYEQLHTGKTNFYEIAKHHFLSRAEFPQCYSYTPFEVIQRRMIPQSIREAIFLAMPDEVIGPIRTNGSYIIAHILSIKSAQLDEITRNAVKNILFENWLEDRRQMATIEWYWG